MFKVFKYMLIANIYKKAKTSFILVFASLVALILLSFILNDIIKVSNGMEVYILLGIKWVGVLSLLGVVGYNIIKIINIATTPFESQKASGSNDLKKEHILKKDTLLTKSDLILRKYQRGI